MFFNFQTFQGNTEIDTVVENRLSRVILTRLLRIMPVLWFTAPALRMEVIGSYVGEHMAIKPLKLTIESNSFEPYEFSLNVMNLNFAPNFARPLKNFIIVLTTSLQTICI